MSAPPSPPRTRHVLVLVTLVFCVAFALRAWRPGHLGLGHYDEGVYAISAAAVATWPEGDLFPGQTRFAPPAWFGTVGAVARVTGLPPHIVALSLNVVLGALTAAAVAAIGAAWFGIAAGAAAGIVVALDPLSLMLSRSGLTDPLFAFWFLLAVAALGRALTRGGVLPCLVAGVATGLAWNTKYHGWFAIVVAVGAIALMRLFGRRGPERVAVPVAAKRLAAVTAIAAACYLPWALYMRGASGGRGLAGIVDYYLTLIGGDWLGRAMEHVAMQAWLDGPWVRAAVPLALAAVLAVDARRPGPRRLATAMLAIIVATLLGGGILAIAVLAAFGLAAVWRRPGWPAALLTSWVALWLVAAPFYESYARLLLPLLVALGIAAGAGTAALAARLETRSGGPALSRAVASLSVLALAGVLALLPMATPDAARPWHDARGSARAAAWIDHVAPPGAMVAVVGEPSIAYYLRQRGRAANAVVDELASLDTASAVTWVAAGRYARIAPPIRDALDRLGERRQRIGAHPIDPNDLRLLDDLSPPRARAWRRQPDGEFAVTLYRVEPSLPLRNTHQAMRP